MSNDEQSEEVEVPTEASEGFAVLVRAMQFAKNMMYSAQFEEILPLLEEMQSYDEDDPRVKMIDAVLTEVIDSFPLLDVEV